MGINETGREMANSKAMGLDQGTGQPVGKLGIWQRFAPQMASGVRIYTRAPGSAAWCLRDEPLSLATRCRDQSGLPVPALSRDRPATRLHRLRDARARALRLPAGRQRDDALRNRQSARGEASAAFAASPALQHRGAPENSGGVLVWHSQARRGPRGVILLVGNLE
jgi:hypothetical protein